MATWYISPTGNDSTGDGSTGNPWLTSSKAVTSATSGDTIIHKDGTYGALPATTTTKDIIHRAENIGMAVCDLNFTAGTGYWGSAYAGRSYTFDGFHITNARPGYYFFAMEGPTGASQYWYNCRFSNIRLNPSGAVNLIGTFSVNNATLVYDRCIFQDISVVTSNTIGVFSKAVGTGSVMSVTNCSLYLTDTGGHYFSKLFNANSNQFFTFKNNIITATGATPYGTLGAANTTLSHCCFHNITSAPTGSGHITSDPLLVDPANGNFDLRPNSPCINSGTLI
jgi:hypothetical protein